MDRKTLTGAVLAAAVGAMFLTSPVFAQDLDLVKGFSDVLGENSPLWR